DLERLRNDSPNDREDLRLLVLTMLRQSDKWRGNVLQTQVVPLLKSCESIIRRNQTSSPENDQLFVWALSEVLDQSAKMGDLYHGANADLDSIRAAYEQARLPTQPGRRDYAGRRMIEMGESLGPQAG